MSQIVENAASSAGPSASSPKSKGSKLPPGVTRVAVVIKRALPLALLGMWQLWATLQPTILIPPPSKVAVALWEMMISGELWQALWLSNQAFLIGATAALIFGVMMGVLLGRSPRLNRILGIYVDIDLALPTIALLPIVIIVFGIDLFARSVVVFTFAFAMVVSLVRTGARTVDDGLVEMGNAFAPTRAQFWRKILIPGLLPALGGAIRIAISRGVVGMIIVELVLTTVGIGGLIMDSRASFQPDRVYAGVIAVCVEALLLMALGRAIQRRIAPEGLYGGAR